MLSINNKCKYFIKLFIDQADDEKAGIDPNKIIDLIKPLSEAKSILE
ncbi:MAG: hypothetical protein JKY30_04990 [Flavobacteriales bacterium]|nr:hypothetical protein [Flavobacteriales bacterium]